MPNDSHNNFGVEMHDVTFPLLITLIIFLINAEE